MYALDALLYDGFGAFVAREQSHIHSARTSNGEQSEQRLNSLAVAEVGTVRIENGIEFGVNHCAVHAYIECSPHTVWILGVERVRGGLGPGQLVVIASDGHTIVADADNMSMRVYNACTHLCSRMFYSIL